MNVAAKPSAPHLRALCDWAVARRDRGVPPAILRRAAMVLLDDLASAVAAKDEPEIVALIDGPAYAPGDATLWVAPHRKLERAQAAMLNSIAANWCQLDEGHRKVMCHAGLYTVPPILADAEADGRTMREVLTAVALGYEIVCRFAETWTFPDNAVHPHAIWSALGAAASVALMRGAKAPHFYDIVTTAVTLGQPGPFRHGVKGALIQNAWTGLGVATGFRCLDLVAAGMTGLASSPDDVLGLLLGAAADPGRLDARLDESWALESSYHKIHACAQQSHATVEAVLQLLARRPDIAPADVRTIEIHVHPLGLKMDNPQPTTTLSARFSIPHIAAAVLRFGHASAAAFATDTLRDPAIGELRAKTKLALFEPRLPWPDDRAARVTIRFTDGTTMTEECRSARGGPDRPYGDDVIRKKCVTLAHDAFPNFGALFAIADLDAARLAETAARFLARAKPFDH